MRLLCEERPRIECAYRREREGPHHPDEDVDADRAEHRSEVDHASSHQRVDDHERRGTDEEQVEHEEASRNPLAADEGRRGCRHERGEHNDERESPQPTTDAGGGKGGEEGGALQHDGDERHPIAGRPRGEEDERGQEQQEDDAEAVRGHGRRRTLPGAPPSVHGFHVSSFSTMHLIPQTIRARGAIATAWAYRTVCGIVSYRSLIGCRYGRVAWRGSPRVVTAS
jgi:hypothetical protein